MHVNPSPRSFTAWLNAVTLPLDLKRQAGHSIQMQSKQWASVEINVVGEVGMGMIMRMVKECVMVLVVGKVGGGSSGSGDGDTASEDKVSDDGRDENCGRPKNDVHNKSADHTNGRSGEKRWKELM